MPEELCGAGDARPRSRLGALGQVRVRPKVLLLSIVLGTLVWIYVDSWRTELQTFQVALNIRVPAGWEVESGAPARVTIRVRGARQVMAGLKDDEIRVVRSAPMPAPAEEALYRPTLQISSRDVVGLPPEAKVTSVEPVRITPVIVRQVSEHLLVKLVTVGKPKAGHEMVFPQIEPRSVEVTVPKGFIDGVNDRINTMPVDISGRESGFGTYVHLQPFTKGGRTLHVSKQVYASIQIIPKPVSRRLEAKVPVRIILAPDEVKGEIAIQPAAVTVTVEGLIENVTNLDDSTVKVVVDSHDKVPDGKGRFLVKCRSLPLKQVTVTRIEPEEVRMIVRAPAAGVSKGDGLKTGPKGAGGRK